jgi:hypothetical protein
LGYLYKPHGRSNAKVYLVNLSDNSIVGEYETRDVADYAKEEWDTPPAYYALTQAVRNSPITVLDKIYSIISRGHWVRSIPPY